MPEERKKTRKVVWANSTGKPLTQTRLINKEGRGTKIVKQNRQFVYANPETITKKHKVALQRVKDRARSVEKKLESLKTNARTMANFEKMTAQKLQKTTKPEDAAKLKNTLAKVKKSKNALNKTMSVAQLNFNEAMSKLNAQRKAIVKEKEKAGFKFFGKK